MKLLNDSQVQVVKSNAVNSRVNTRVNSKKHSNIIEGTCRVLEPFAEYIKNAIKDDKKMRKETSNMTKEVNEARMLDNEIATGYKNPIQNGLNLGNN